MKALQKAQNYFFYFSKFSFYSTPNLNNDPKSSISLDARIFDNGNLRNPPIAPPRKKRTTLKKGSTLPTSFSHDNVKNGFKDVFGNTSDIEFIDKDDNSLQERSMGDPRTSTPAEKKLKVGNKKSDKFFGEDLSDHLSDEPVSPIRHYNEDESDNSKSDTDKKLSFFLMNMLDDIRDHVDETKYKEAGKEPVEEPTFVARKKITKHICDDDDHPHHHHHHEKENIAPPKPDRDFSKFKADSIEDQIEKEVRKEEVQAKVIMKRGISRENLPSPPDTPRRKTGNVNLPTTPTITIETIELNMTERNDDTEDFKKSTENIKEKIESNSHKITNMVDEMIKKAYGIGSFSPEDYSHNTSDDGSNLVLPTSKLAVRKISTPRKVSTESAPAILEGSDKVLMAISSEDKAKIDNLLENDDTNVPKSPVKLRSDEEKVSVTNTTMNDIIDEIYSRNSEIMKEFQSFLEQSIEKDPIIDVDEEKKFVDRKEVMEEFKAEIQAENQDMIDEEIENRRYSDSFESSDDEQQKIDKPNHFAITQAAKKSSSIKDCDNWFSHHVEHEETESDVCNNVRDLERPIGYDHNKIFPFGNTITGRRDSLSDEFFKETSNAILTKLPISTVRESESSVEESENNDEKEKEKPRSGRSSESPDHSTLFKYLDKSANESLLDDKK